MRRLKRFSFWLLVVFTALLMAVNAVSFVTGTGVVVSGPVDQQALSRRAAELELHRAAVSIEYYPSQDLYHGPEGVDGFVTEFWSGGPYRPRSSHAWLWPSTWRGGSSAGSFIRWELPLATPAAISVMLLGWFLIRKRRRRSGFCPSCNYDLASITGPCPECGHAAPGDTVSS